MVPALAISDTANVSSAVPGGAITYTVTLSNTGQTAYTNTAATISLAAAVDDAVYTGGANAGSGALAYDSTSSSFTWTGDIAVGAQVQITIPVTVRNPDPGDRSVTTVVSSAASGSTCPSGSANSACTAQVPVLIPALTIAKSADSSSTTPGSVVRYTVSLTNTGQTAYTAAAFTDNLSDVLDDAGYDNDAVASAGTASFSSGTLSWTGNLAVGATATVTYSVTVKDPDTGNRSLADTVVSTTPFNNCPAGSADTRCSTAVAVLLPALSLAVNADSATTTPGSVVHYTFTITDSGQTTYNGLTATLNISGLLDDAVYNNDAVASSGSLQAQPDGTFTWVGTLAPGATATNTLSVTVRSPDPGDRSMRSWIAADVAGSNCPTGSANASCRSAVAVLTPGLTITKSADSTSVQPGDTVTYTVTVVNSGETSYTAASFSDSLAQVLTDAVYNSDATASTGSVAYAASVLTWTGSLAPGATATISYSVTVRNPDPGDKRMTNTVVSSSAGSNCAAGSADPRCTVAVNVLVPGLTIVNTATVPSTTAGSTVTFSVSVTNTGQTAYTGAALTVSLAGVLDDATYNSDATATSGTVAVNGATLTWTGNLAVGNHATITYSATVSQAPGDNLLTDTVVSSTTGNNCPAGSADTRCSVSVPVARLVISQGYQESSTTPGSLIHLSATFTNTGQVPYTGITVLSPSTDTVDDATPTGDQVASSGTLTLTPTAITWTGNIPVGGIVTVTGTLTVQKPGHRKPADHRDAGVHRPREQLHQRQYRRPVHGAAAGLAAGTVHHQVGRHHRHRPGRHGRVHHHHPRFRPDAIHRSCCR